MPAPASSLLELLHLLSGVGKRVVKHVEGEFVVTNVKLERFARLVVMNLDRDVAGIGVPEQANLNAVGAAAVEFSRQRSDRYVAEPGRLGRDEGMCWECIVGSLDA